MEVVVGRDHVDVEGRAAAGDGQGQHDAAVAPQQRPRAVHALVHLHVVAVRALRVDLAHHQQAAAAAPSSSTVHST